MVWIHIIIYTYPNYIQGYMTHILQYAAYVQILTDTTLMHIHNPTQTHTPHTYTYPTERESRFYMFVHVQNIARLYLKSLQANLQVDVYEQIQKNTSNSKTKLRRNSFAVNCTQARNHMADVASHRLGRAPVNQARRKLLMDRASL